MLAWVATYFLDVFTYTDFTNPSEITIPFFRKWVGEPDFKVNKLVWLLERISRFLLFPPLFLYGGFTRIRDVYIGSSYKAITEYILYGMPNTIHCYTKGGFFIFFADFWCVFWVFYVLGRRPVHSAVYFYLKCLITILPYMAFSPIERLPFWLITIPLMFVEIIVAVAIGPLVAYGLDWNEAPHTLYKKWSKHFRYRRPTYNRNLTVEFLTYAYCVTKAFAVAGYFCHDSRTAIKRLINPYSPAVAHEKLKEPYKPSAEVIEQLKFHPNPSTRSAVINAELKTPRTQAKAELIPDTEYLLGLVEQDSVVNFRYGLLLILALSSLAVYSIILAGWSSNSKYAFIGALRSAAQMISYEVAISLILLPIILLAGSMNLTMIIFTQNSTVLFILPLAPAALLFLIAILAETNRTPFDLPEAEAELVAGYNVDYSGLPFAMFFLGEYCNIIFASSLFCLFFLGGGGIDEFSAIMLPLKASFVWIFFVLVRATLPRYRYDQLMDIGWKVFLPVSGSFFIFVIGLLVFFGACPVTSELLH